MMGERRLRYGKQDLGVGNVGTVRFIQTILRKPQSNRMLKYDNPGESLLADCVIFPLRFSVQADTILGQI